MRLPKRSVCTTAPATAPATARTSGHDSRTGSLTGGPRRAGSRPLARWAAAGANRSRPWKVRLTTGSRKSASASSKARQSPSSRNGVNRPLSGPTNTWPAAARTSPRRSVPTPGSTTARCTVPAGKNGAAASSARAPSVTSCAATSWLTSTSRASRAIPRITPFMAATYGSRVPKSVVSVTMGATSPIGSPVAVDHEVGDEGEQLALLRGRKHLQVALGVARVAVGAFQRVLDPVVREDEAPDLLDLRGLQRPTAQEQAHAVGLRLAHALEHGDERQRALALAEVGGDGLAEASLVGQEIPRVVGHLEGDADVEAVAGEGVELRSLDAAEQRADAAARRHEGGRLLRDDPDVVRLGGEPAALELQLVDLGLRHRDGRACQRLHDRAVVVAHEQGEGLRVQMVAHEHGGVVTPLRVGRGLAAPQRRLVDHVVVNERRRVQELDAAGEADGARAAVAGQTRGQQQ